MFTGIGGFEYGIESALNHQCETGEVLESVPDGAGELPSWECVGYSEIDKHATAVYKYHYGTEVKNYGDATRINPEDIADFDLLVGGFPCQAFSLAGKRRGFEDTRGTLFYEVARIAKSKRPRLMVLENVKGLCNHDEGKTLATILSAIWELGYEYQWGVVNSRYHGVPQNRERILIVCNLRGTPRPEVFPLVGTILADSREGEAAGVILQHSRDEHGNTVAYNAKECAGTVKQPSGNQQNFLLVRGDTAHESDVANTLDANYYKGLGANQTRAGIVTPTLTARCDDRGFFQRQLMEQTALIRRLTPLECERLQAFPDDWTRYGINEKGEEYLVSDTQRYKMCGNAVTTSVIAAVMRKVLK
jgi:DNA (cytosine-5)-methyltransferase 1